MKNSTRRLLGRILTDVDEALMYHNHLTAPVTLNLDLTGAKLWELVDSKVYLDRARITLKRRIDRTCRNLSMYKNLRVWAEGGMSPRFSTYGDDADVAPGRIVTAFSNTEVQFMYEINICTSKPVAPEKQGKLMKRVTDCVVRDTAPTLDRIRREICHIDDEVVDYDVLSHLDDEK